MKINKYLLTILLGLLLFSFYWFQYRPSKIKQNCFNEIHAFCIKSGDSNPRNCTSESYSKWIAICLKKNGL